MLNIDPNMLMQMLTQQDPAMMDQLATQLTAANIPPPPPGSMAQARGMFAQQGALPGMGLDGGTQVNNAGGPPGGVGTLGDILTQSQAPMPNPATPQAGSYNPLQPGGMLFNGNQFAEQQESPEDRAKRLALAGQALQGQQNRGQTQPASGYFNPPALGAASPAQPLVAPQGLSPRGGGIPSLGMLLGG